VTDDKSKEVTGIVAKRLGYEFVDPGLLLKALTHKSFANEQLTKGEDNQRLEFLGDAVLGLVVAEELMDRLPGAPEGQLTPKRAAIVNEIRLAELAAKINLGTIIRLGRGEEKNNGRDRSSILADAVEAVIGAIYLDGGFSAAKQVVINWLGSALDNVAKDDFLGDPKTLLQEKFQSLNTEAPIYRVVNEEGPDHDKIFEVEISLGDTVLARGRGKSKKDAEKDAAKRALETAEEGRCAQ
jgi:ribonuclease-3